NARMAAIYREELEDILATTLSNLRAASDELAQFACDLFSATEHALPTYVAAGARALPQLPGDVEQMAVRPPTPSSTSGESAHEPAAKRVRTGAKAEAAEQLAKAVLLTTQSFAQDSAFAEAAEQVDVDDEVLLSLFLVRVAATPESPWHAAAKRLEEFRHPMLLLPPRAQKNDDADLERFADALDELCEIHGALFPLLSTHFPGVFPAAAFTLDRFLWAAGIVDMFGLEYGSTTGGVCLL
ncbi:hypothetical protein GGI23_006293, partial [Coemansia sp. RSA 2559]